MIAELFAKGGPVMYPILLCSIIGLAVFMERLYVLQKKRVIPRKLIEDVETLVKAGKRKEARVLCEHDGSAIADVLLAVLQSNSGSREFAREAVEEAGKRKIRALERNVGILGVIASIGPLLGLFGTVTGMIKTFHVISLVGTGDAGRLAGGISEALITTEFGLLVAIPALIAYKFCMSKAEGLIHEMEQSAFRLLSNLHPSEA